MYIFIVITIFLSSLSFTNSDPQMSDDPEEMILGTWVHESDPKSVMEFKKDGVLHSIYDDDLSIESWEIVEECAGETVNTPYDFAMLLIKSPDIDHTQCYVIQGLNGRLTLLALPQGRLIIYDRVDE